MTRAANHSGARPPLLSELLPDLVDELAQGLLGEGRGDLTPQLRELVVESRCGCQQPDCATIYVAGGKAPLTEEQKRERGEHWQETVPIEADGHIAVDTDRYDRISGIEILGRSDIRAKLGSLRWRR